MENDTKKKSLFGISGLLVSSRLKQAVRLSGNFEKTQIPKLRCINLGTCGSAWLSMLSSVSPDIQCSDSVVWCLEEQSGDSVFNPKAGTQEMILFPTHCNVVPFKILSCYSPGLEVSPSGDISGLPCGLCFICVE